MIAIIEYNAGNISSIKNALDRLGHDSIITNNQTQILEADKVIFPGVGEASSAMKYLVERGLDQTILQVEKPMLGICLGLQLMCRQSEEGDTICLGIFDADVKKFPARKKVPHMGWNNFQSIEGSLFREVDVADDVYYVHCYYAEQCEQTIASCNYIFPFSTAMHKNNFYATQFHPEKSADVGTQILKNFITL